MNCCRCWQLRCSIACTSSSSTASRVRLLRGLKRRHYRCAHAAGVRSLRFDGCCFDFFFDSTCLCAFFNPFDCCLLREKQVGASSAQASASASAGYQKPAQPAQPAQPATNGAHARGASKQLSQRLSAHKSGGGGSAAGSPIASPVPPSQPRSKPSFNRAKSKPAQAAKANADHADHADTKASKDSKESKEGKDGEKSKESEEPKKEIAPAKKALKKKASTSAAPAPVASDPFGPCSARQK